MITDNINEIDWAYIEWGLNNELLLQENKVDSKIKNAVLESFNKISEMLHETSKIFDELYK